MGGRFRREQGDALLTDQFSFEWFVGMDKGPHAWSYHSPVLLSTLIGCGSFGNNHISDTPAFVASEAVAAK
jgi:hypothetical protein